MADLVDPIGSFGRWQAFFVAFVTYRGIVTGLNNLAYVFLVTNNDHWCSYPVEHGNMSGEQLKEMFIPYDNVSGSYSQCLRYDVPLNGTRSTGVDNATTVPCDSWIYEEHVFGRSTSNEGDLVCDRKWQKSLIQSFYMGCLMLAVIVIGNLSDRYGRRIVGICSSILLALASVACVLSNSLYLFLAARVGIAFGISGLQFASFSLLAETTGQNSRIALNICFGYGWIAGLLLLPWIVWLVEDWRKMQIVNFVFAVPILVMLPWVYEFPRWLLSTGQKTKACEPIKKITKFNRRGPQDIKQEVERLMENKVGVDKSARGKVSTVELFKTKHLRRNTILLISCSFFSYMVYYGFARSSTSLDGNPYINFAITAATKAPGTRFRSAPRSTSKGYPLWLGTMASLVSPCLPLPSCQKLRNLSVLRITISMMGWLVYTFGCTTQFIYRNEFFPTVARSGAFGLCTTLGRLGATFKPWIYVIMLSWGDTLVLIVYGVMILALAALVTLLPKTFGSVLNDTLEEGERFSQSKLSKKNVQDHAGHLEAHKKVDTGDGGAEIKV